MPEVGGDRFVRMRRNLLWIDCGAAAVVGVAVLLLHGWLSDLYRLPRELLLFMGAANLAYGLYSFSLALRARRPLPLIRLLVGANLTWSLILLSWIVVFSRTASLFGLAYLLLEALFVAGLGLLEWRSRELLLVRTAG